MSRQSPPERPDRDRLNSHAHGRAPVGDGRVLVVVPTYDEAASVEQVLHRLRRVVPDADVLVVDDASPDGTGAIVEALGAGDRQVHLLRRPGKQGLGAAYLAGFRWGLERCYDVFVEMDADGSHQPEQLPALLTALRDADLVIGSRWVTGGRVRNWPARRRALSLGANVYTRVALGLPVRDATGGYRAVRRRALEGLRLDEVSSQGYCFQVDLAWRAARAGCRIVEVPITFVDRTAGTSKMSGSVVREALWLVTAWGLRHRAGQLLRAGRAGRPSARGGR